MYLYTGIQTTGLDFEKDDIVRLSYIIEDENYNIIEQDMLEIKPREGKFPSQISADALRINNLTLDKLRTFMPPEEACIKFINIIKKYKYTYVGHYVDFDLSFINNFIKMYSDCKTEDFIEETTDIIEMTKRVEIQNNKKYFYNYRLKTLADYFNLKYNASEIETKVIAIRNLHYKITDW